MPNGYQPSRIFNLGSDALNGLLLFGIVVCVAALPARIPEKHIEILKVRPVTIDSAFLRDPVSAGKLYWEPGGWIADDKPMRKGESVHSKGMQPLLSGAEPDSSGGMRLRTNLKSWASEEDLSKIVVSRETRGNKE